MTRAEFDEQVTDWQSLIDFCMDEHISVVDDVCAYDYMYELVQSEVEQYIREGNEWTDLLSRLQDIDTGYDYYERGDGWFDFTPLDDYDDFDRYRDDVIDEMDGAWDEDAEDEVIEEEYDQDDTDELFCEEDFSVDTLLSGCFDALRLIQSRSKEEEEEQYKKLMEIIMY